MTGFKTPTQAELHEEYKDMLRLLGEPEKLESHILAKGRLEMQHILAYLLTRCAMFEIERLKRDEEF